MASSYLGDLFSVLFDAMRSSMLVVRIGIRIGIRLRLRIRIRLRIHPVYVECSAVQCSGSGHDEVQFGARLCVFGVLVVVVFDVVFVWC